MVGKPLVWDMKMWSPVQNGWVGKRTGLMGCRRLSHHGEGILDDRCPAGSKWHAGLDFGSSVGEGAPVYAVDDGKIFYASNVNGSRGYGGYGRVVVLKVGAEYVLYAHLKDVYVTTGDHVDAGKVLGTVGRTRGSVSNPGEMFRSSGAHLHFEVSAHRYPKEYGAGNVDPLEWLAFGGTSITEGSTGYRIRHSEENMAADPNALPAPIPEPTDSDDHWFLESMRIAARSQSQTIRNVEARLLSMPDDPVTRQWLSYFRTSQAMIIMEYGWMSAILLSPTLTNESKQHAIELENAAIMARATFYSAIMRGDAIGAGLSYFRVVVRSSRAVYNFFFNGLRRDVVIPTVRRSLGAIADTMGEAVVEGVKDIYNMTPDLFPGDRRGFKWGRLVLFGALAAAAFAWTKYKFASIGTSSPTPPTFVASTVKSKSNPKRGKKPSARRLVK